MDCVHSKTKVNYKKQEYEEKKFIAGLKNLFFSMWFLVPITTQNSYALEISVSIFAE